MAETSSVLTRVLTGRATAEDHRIARNRALMGVLLLRKNDGSAIGSGSIVDMMRSEHFPKQEKRWCLLTSNVFPPGEITMDNYSFECDSNQKVKLGDVAKVADCYQPTPGLVLIPVHPTKSSTMSYSVSSKSSVFDKRRTFPTEYYNEESEWRSDKSCFIAGSSEGTKNSWTVERFTLKTNKFAKDDQGQLKTEYVLQADDGGSFRSLVELKTAWPHLHPCGAVILKGEGQEATCIGVLNFSGDEIKEVSPLFFTPHSLTGTVQLYYPLPGTSGHSGGRNEVDTSVKDDSLQPPQVISDGLSPSTATGKPPSTQAEPENPLEGTTPGEFTVPSDDYTSKGWEELYRKAEDEYAQLKRQSELDFQEMSHLKIVNSDLRNDVKKIGQENEELRIEMKELEGLRAENETLSEERKRLLTENTELRHALHRKTIEMCNESTELLKKWGAQTKESDAEINLLHQKLLHKSNELHVIKKSLGAENAKLREENEELRTENEDLHARVNEMPAKLKQLLHPNDNAKAGFVDDASISESSKDEKAEGACGSSADNNQQALHVSSEEKTFLDPLSSDVSKLE